MIARDPHIGEELLAEACLAGHQTQGNDLDTLGVDRNDEDAQTTVFRGVPVRAGHHQAVIAQVAEARPDLRSDDGPFITIAIGPRECPRQVSFTRPFGENLDPYVLAVQETAYMTLLLLLRTELQDGWADHAEGHAEEPKAGQVIALTFGIERLHVADGQPLAAVRLGIGQARKPALGDDPLQSLGSQD